jgi:hypothetical protein
MKKSAFRRSSVLACASALALVAAGATNASQYSINMPATNWRMQNFTGNQVYLFFTGSACANGQLALPAGESADRQKLLAATILSSKATGYKMVIGYDMAGTTCTIADFGLDGP